MNTASLYYIAVVLFQLGCVVANTQHTGSGDPRCPADFDPLKSCPSSMILPGGAGFDLTRSIDPTTCNDQENCPRCLGDDTWIQKLKDEIGLYTAARNADFKPWVHVDNWLSHEILATITMILLRDTMNISARAAAKYTQGNTDYICCKEAFLNMEQWATQGIFLNDATEGTLISKSNGYQGQSGFFVPPYTVEKYPLAFTYHAYRLVEAYKTIFPPSFSTDCTNMTVNSSAGCVAGNYVCESNFWTNTTGKWYVPPQCNVPGEVGNPNTTKCQEILMADPYYDTGVIEGMIKNNGLNMTMAYVGLDRHNSMVRDMVAQKKDFVFYWYVPDPLVTQVGAKMIDFDPVTEECNLKRNIDPTLNTATCGYPALSLQKRIRASALESDVDFKYFFNTFSLDPATIDALLASHTSAGGNSTVYDLSCNWIKNNFDTWKGMVQNTPPTQGPTMSTSASALANKGVLAAIGISCVVVVLLIAGLILWICCRHRLALRRAPLAAPLAMVFTDIENSTMLWEVCGDDMGLAVEIHHAIIRKHIEEFGAYEVKTIGDSFMIACSSLGDATLMCLAIQTSLGECRDFPPRLQYTQQQAHRVPSSVSQASFPSNSVKLFDQSKEGPSITVDASGSGFPGQHSNRAAGSECSDMESSNVVPFNYPLRIRIGLHWCREVNPHLDRIHGRFDYYGHDVNVCARVEAQASGGQIMVTASTMTAIMNTDVYSLLIAPDTISTIAKRNVELKGVSDRVVLYVLAPQGAVESGYIKPNLVRDEAPASSRRRSTKRSVVFSTSLMLLGQSNDVFADHTTVSGGTRGDNVDDDNDENDDHDEGDTNNNTNNNDEEQHQFIACRKYTLALFRATFKAVPQEGKNNWLVAMSRKLGVQEQLPQHQNDSRPGSPSSNDRLDHAKRLEYLREIVEENCNLSTIAMATSSGSPRRGGNNDSDISSAPLVVTPSEFAKSYDEGSSSDPPPPLNIPS